MSPRSLGGGFYTGIAQLVEHRSPKPRVVGSSPPSRAELTHSAMVVLSASLIIALVVFIMDFVFQNVMQLVYPS